MTRKATAKKSAKAGGAKPAKRAAEPKATVVYTVVRPLPAESPVFTEPDRVFASKAAARAHADALNRELRAVACPFDVGCDPDDTMTGGEPAFVSLVKKLGLVVPAKQKGYSFIDWQEWWDRSYFDMTDAQRDALWDALDKYDWYRVKATTLEG